MAVSFEKHSYSVHSNFVDTPCCEGEEEGVCNEGGGGEDQEETQLGSTGAKLPAISFERYYEANYISKKITLGSALHTLFFAIQNSLSTVSLGKLGEEGGDEGLEAEEE